MAVRGSGLRAPGAALFPDGVYTIRAVALACSKAGGNKGLKYPARSVNIIAWDSPWRNKESPPDDTRPAGIFAQEMASLPMLYSVHVPLSGQTHTQSEKKYAPSPPRHFCASKDRVGRL